MPNLQLGGELRQARLRNRPVEGVTREQVMQNPNISQTRELQAMRKEYRMKNRQQQRAFAKQLAQMRSAYGSAGSFKMPSMPDPYADYEKQLKDNARIAWKMSVQQAGPSHPDYLKAGGDYKAYWAFAQMFPEHTDAMIRAAPRGFQRWVKQYYSGPSKALGPDPQGASPSTRDVGPTGGGYGPTTTI